jgi:hypothetical protein
MSQVKNSAQVLSCSLRFVYGKSRVFAIGKPSLMFASKAGAHLAFATVKKEAGILP